MESESSYPVITLDRIYSSRPRLEVNRILVYTQGRWEKILAQRPHFPPINQQVSELVKGIKNREVAISDIGAWTGSTILSIKKLFETFGYEVKEVILAISTREALKNLQKNNLSVKTYRVY